MAYSAEYVWLSARLEATEAMIEATEAAILALVGGAQVYTLDTGQTRQSVTKANLGSLRLQVDQLMNQRYMLVARRDGLSVIGRPAY